MSQKIIFLASVLMILLCSTEGNGKFNPQRRPKLMGIPMSAIDPSRKKIQDKIVFYHNYYRARVQPSAGNMLRMKWHKEAAKAAQKWAKKCQLLVHDNVTGRHIENYGACGQNIFIATKQVPWLFAVETWWLEKEDYVYGKTNNLSTLIGHYTQMVWAASHEIGCGLAKCQHPAKVYEKAKNGTIIHTKTIQQVYYNYVCNYCPIGNRPGRLAHPYKQGNPCSLCKRHCGGKLCLNACPVADLWANCRQLHAAFGHWLCNAHTQRGRERAAHCRATCTCKHDVHD